MYGPKVVCLPNKQPFIKNLVNNSYPFNKTSPTRSPRVQNPSDRAQIVGRKIEIKAT